MTQQEPIVADNDMNMLDAPFPWFGGKRKVGDIVWKRFGDVKNYVEPFFGSGAVLLKRPRGFSGTETVNDIDGFIANFWRSIRLSPDETAKWADNPVNENDQQAVHLWLVNHRDELPALLEGDPDWHHPQVAGWWCWGANCWIGSGWCHGKGSWQSVNGKLTKVGKGGAGVTKQIISVAGGRGVNRQIVHLGSNGNGVNRQAIHFGEPGDRIRDWFRTLADRLRAVRVCSGDWSRVVTPAVTHGRGLTGVFLDPPYSDESDTTTGLYTKHSGSIAHDVREWAIEQGKNPLMRIALCGYEREHKLPDDWECYAWEGNVGYALDGQNRAQERIWFSPHCQSKEAQGDIFSLMANQDE